MMGETDPRRAVLEGLSRRDEPLVAILAEALTPLADLALERAGEQALKIFTDRLAVLAEEAALAPTAGLELVHALVTIDAHLAAAGAISAPWATSLAPLAALLVAKNRKARALEQAEQALIRDLPISRLDRKTIVCAVPCGLRPERLEAYFDRVLAKASRGRIKRVLLLASRGEQNFPSVLEQGFREELAALGIKLELLEPLL